MRYFHLSLFCSFSPSLSFTPLPPSLSLALFLYLSTHIPYVTKALVLRSADDLFKMANTTYQVNVK